MIIPRYRHVGTQPIVVGDREVRPGEEFSADLADAQRDFFVSIGAVEIIPEPPPVDIVGSARRHHGPSE